jgi:Flagellar GTP-binding protein
MKIKRFVASDMRTALRMVRAEHGPDAVILSNRRTEEGVEIVAASNYDEDAVQRALLEAHRASEPAPQPQAAVPAQPAAPAPSAPHPDFAAAMAAALATPTARAVSVLPPEVVMAHPARPAARPLPRSSRPRPLPGPSPRRRRCPRCPRPPRPRPTTSSCAPCARSWRRCAR